MIDRRAFLKLVAAGLAGLALRPGWGRPAAQAAGQVGGAVPVDVPWGVAEEPAGPMAEEPAGRAWLPVVGK